jgi:hypothetical protein
MVAVVSNPPQKLQWGCASGEFRFGQLPLLAAVAYLQPVIGQVCPVGQGLPSAKLGTVTVVSNRTAASTSKSFFMVLLLF